MVNYTLTKYIFSEGHSNDEFLDSFRMLFNSIGKN